MIRAAALALCAAAPAAAQDVVCLGTAPNWSLRITGDTARLRTTREIDFDIPHRARAEGRDWPRALTLIGLRDSAVVVLDRLQCDAHPVTAHVLTQRGTTPILLTGCCEVVR
ncbi:hypothetical protein DXV76_11010 [Rhodobacteraceae bacterium CCMM004]|nr:hypothetical protein DXV76_11010 [Rhodobacteraceae bacterium CCMM004]